MPVQPDLLEKPQAAYVTAAALPTQYPKPALLTWVSYERLQAELPEGELIEQHADGLWYRKTRPHDGSQRVVDGVLQYGIKTVWRRVALSLDEARDLSGKGPAADFWCGWCWIRAGVKPERDWNVIQAQGTPETIDWEPAPPSDQAAASAVIAQQTAVQSARLVAVEQPKSAAHPAAPTPKE